MNNENTNPLKPVKHSVAIGVNIRQTSGKYGIDPTRVTATALIGRTVKSIPGDKQLGVIQEIVFDLTTGAVRYVVLAVGGFAGIGDKFFAVPLEALTFDPGQKEFYLKIDKQILTKSPGFDKTDWPLSPHWPPV